MKVKMLNNGLIYDLEDNVKRYEPNEQGIWNSPVLLEDIETYLMTSESIIIKRWPE